MDICKTETWKGSPTVQAAIDKCRQHGIDTGNEYLIAIVDDKVVWESEGDKMHVEVEDMPDVSGGICVHNHPGIPNGLSFPDVAMATQKGCMIYAVCDNGDLYWSRGFKDKTAIQGKKGIAKFHAFNGTQEEGQGIIFALFPQYGSELCSYSAAHCTQCMLAESFGLDYHYELTDKTAEMYRTIGGVVK